MNGEKQTRIYYFSGTGNTHSIATDLAGMLEAARAVRLIRSSQREYACVNVTCLGIVFPVYYRGLPKIVADFLTQLHIQEDPYIFAVANYGSAAALSFEQIETILCAKGYHLNANFGIEMPGNMWPLYYPHSKEDITIRLALQKERTEKIACQIKQQIRRPLPEILHREKEQAIYNAFQPQIADSAFWLNDKCIGCGTCFKVCPAANIRMQRKRPVWQHACEMCLGCFHLCPVQAIEFKNDSLGVDRYHHPRFTQEQAWCRDFHSSSTCACAGRGKKECDR